MFQNPLQPSPGPEVSFDCPWTVCWQFHCHPHGRAAVDNSLKLNLAGKCPSAVLNLGPRKAADFPKRTVCVAHWTLRKESPTTVTHLSCRGGHGLGVSQPWQHLWCRWTNIRSSIAWPSTGEIHTCCTEARGEARWARRGFASTHSF